MNSTHLLLGWTAHAILGSAAQTTPAAKPAHAATVAADASDLDSDGDGLSDFQELHKYFTDPTKADSDGDGIPDGDWNERREFTYTVRTILQVAPPVTPDVFCDDYQDARVLDEHPDYVELEVVHYPLNTVAGAIVADPDWRETVKRRSDLAPYLEPTTTANFDAAMSRELVAALAKDGIDVAKLDDKTLVERTTRWLLDHTKFEDGFTTYCATFEGGVARVLPGLEPMAEDGRHDKSRSLEETWQRELFAKGMWTNRVHGTCTSSAILWAGCLRAVGIPTRIVLTSPLVDASDPRELGLARTALTRATVRRTVLGALESNSNGWTNHTFDEVFVGGRWRRLNYDKLGQDTLDANYEGLMTHLATFRDWADGEMAKTWGTRQAHRNDKPDVFGFANPYSAISLSDRVGVHAKLPPDPVTADADGPTTVTIDALYWSDDPKLPDWVRDGAKEQNHPMLFAHVAEWSGWPNLKAFLRRSDRRLLLESPGRPTLKVGLSGGGCTNADGSVRLMMLPLGEADWRDLVAGADYTLRARNEEPKAESSKATWAVADGVRLRRETK